MHDAPLNSARPLVSITPRKKSVRFNITSPLSRAPPSTNPRTHPLNVSYTIPSQTVNIDHITHQSHLQHLNNHHVEYIPTTRRNPLQIQGAKIARPQSAPSSSSQRQLENLDELHEFMKNKAENLRRNMSKITSTFNQASSQLNHLKSDRDTIVKRPSRIPISTRLRSPSPPVVIYKKPQHRSLDHLRWYCLARKFSILWQKLTFGCHLRRIKSYYQKRCLRHYFLLWRQTIREDKSEQQAIEFYHEHLLKEIFHIWYSSTIEHRHQHQLAIEHLHRKRLQTTWYRWKSQLRKRSRHQRLFQMANEKYQRSLLLRFYYHWQMKTRQRQQIEEKSVRAHYHHRLHLQRICFQAWLTYTEYRRRKNLHKNRVRDYYQKRLTGRIYNQWKQALTRKLLIERNENRLAQLQERILLRWAWEGWRSYMKDLLDDERMMQMAEQYSDRRLLRQAFREFHQNALEAQNEQRMNWIAVKHHAKTLQRTFYHLWKDQLERREDVLQLPEYRKAEAFYQMKLTIRCWFDWRRHVNDCRQEHAQLDAADRYYQLKLLKKYFSLLRSNINDERHEQWLEKRADQYYRMRYSRLYYMFWKVQSRIHERYRMNWRLAILHQETNMRRRYFFDWLTRTHQRLIENEQDIVAERHYLRALMVYAWSSWRQLIDEHHQEDRAERIAIQFYYHSIERRVLQAWILYIRHCRYMKQMYRESEQFYVNHRGRSLFSSWLRKARDRRRLTIIVNERVARQQRQLLKSCLRQWRDQVLDEKDERRLTDFAFDHYHRRLKRQVLLAWHQEMIQQLSRDNENQMKFHQYQNVKNQQQLQLIYDRWKSLSQERQRDRILSLRAELFYQQTLLRQTFSVWKEDNDFSRRIRLMERQALWFDRMRLMGRIFVQWKQRWTEEQRCSEQKQRALLFWALQLQKQCFVKWLIYVSERRRKKIRYNEATHCRHNELLRNSLRQFLIYTDHTRQRRQHLFIHQQVYLYHDRNALASKYVAKWRTFVNQVKSRRRDIPRLTKITSQPIEIRSHPMDLVRFDNSPAKISNRPRPRKPAFLSESFSSSTRNIRESSKPTEIASSPPTIDHSLHSPFKTVQPVQTTVEIPSPILLPPSAFQVEISEISLPLSCRPGREEKISVPHRPYSVQPMTTHRINKDNLLHVKQRLEVYLSSKAKLKRLRNQLANGSVLENQSELINECQQLSAFIAREKLQLKDVLQTL